MNFYHCSKSSRAQKFIHHPKRFKPSNFEYVDCLNSWLGFVMRQQRVAYDGLSSIRFPIEYPSERDMQFIYWLGTGLYCFSEEYKHEAIEYAKKMKMDVILKVDYAEEYSIFNMVEKKNILIEFLSDEALSLFHAKVDYPEKIEVFALLMEFLILEIEGEYFDNPQSAAIILEMFLDLKDLNYDVVFNRFIKNASSLTYDNYNVIRNFDSLKSFCFEEDLTRGITN